MSSEVTVGASYGCPPQVKFLSVLILNCVIVLAFPGISDNAEKHKIQRYTTCCKLTIGERPDFPIKTLDTHEINLQRHLQRSGSPSCPKRPPFGHDTQANTAVVPQNQRFRARLELYGNMIKPMAGQKRGSHLWKPCRPALRKPPLCGPKLQARHPRNHSRSGQTT